MAKPLCKINWEYVNELLASGCSGVETAQNIGIAPETLYERTLKDHGISFTEYMQIKKAAGISSIKHQQYLKATGKSKKGDNTMLIWLGKNLCGQSDTPQVVAASEEVIKGFGKVMDQIESYQSQLSVSSVNDLEESLKKQEVPSASNAATISSVINACKESPFM